ncbi:hypothetical protein DFH06DRAFT_1323504 [Mycena polygramma]|nr:hypothetical protein DFH06DRAFT_1323504 [Mycena polygramma]
MAYATAEAPVGYHPRRLGGTSFLALDKDLRPRIDLPRGRCIQRSHQRPPDSNTHCRRNFSAPNARYGLPKAARASSTSFYLTGLRLTQAASTINSTALAFARQPLTPHSALICRGDNKPKLHRPSSQPSKTLVPGARHACEAFAAIILDLIIKVSTALAFLRNTAATSLLPALVLPCHTPLVLDQLLSHRLKVMCLQLLISRTRTNFQKIHDQVHLPGLRSPLGRRSPRIPRFFAGATTSPSFISSHCSRPRFSVGVPDIHVKLLLRSFSTWVSKVSTALALWRNTAANDFAGPVARSALPNPHSTPLKAFFSVSRLTHAAYHIQVLLFFRLEIVSKNQQRPVEPWYLSRLIV